MEYILKFLRHKYSLSLSYPQFPKNIHLLKEISIFKGMNIDGIVPATDTIATIDPMVDDAINSTQ